MDFVKSYFGKNEPLISADLEKTGGQKCSTGQRFILTEVTFYKIHILHIRFVSGTFQLLYHETFFIIQDRQPRRNSEIPHVLEKKDKFCKHGLRTHNG